MEQRLEFLIGFQHLVGNLHLPDKVSKPVSCVVCSHGYQSNRNSEKYLQIGYRFPLEGIAVFRFDHRGAVGGESFGQFADTTLSQRVEDLLAAIEALSRVREIDSNRLGLLGSSLGGMDCLITQSEKVKARVVMSTPFTIPQPSGEASRSFAEKGYYEHPDGSRIKKEFYEDVRQYDMKEVARRVTSPLLIIQGDHDEVVPSQHAQMLFQAAGAKIKELKIIEGGDHSFTDLDKMNQVLKYAQNWFKKHL